MERSTLVARWYPEIRDRWLLGILVSLVLCSVPAGAASTLGSDAASFPGKITLQDGRLTARLAAVPLQQVMEEVSRLSGAQVLWLSQGGKEPVSAEFTGLPFSEALRRILGEKNFMLFYTSTGEDTKLTQIWISSRGKGGGQPVLTPQPVPEVQTTLIAEEANESLTQLLDAAILTALNDQDPSSRLEAITHLEGYAQEDPRAKAILSQLAHSDSNPQVRDVASAVLGGME